MGASSGYGVVRVPEYVGWMEQKLINIGAHIQIVKESDAFAVMDGDSIVIPKGNTFFVFGEVKKPGAYPLDKETNILEGITLAGGFTDKASPGRVRVIRSTAAGGQEVISVDMNDVIKRGQRDRAISLRENDVVVVPESFF